MLENKIVTFPIKLTDHAHQLISRAAKEANMTKQDYILEAVSEKMAKDKKKVM